MSALSSPSAVYTRGAFSSYRGLSTILMVLTVCCLGTLVLSSSVAAAAQLVVALGATALIGWVAARRRPRPTWPTFLLAISQLLLAAQAAVLMASGTQPLLLTYVLVGLSSLCQAVAWTRLALGAGVGWNTASALDTGVILVGLLGSVAILGAPKYTAQEDPSILAVQNLASLVGIVLILVIVYGAFVRRPTPPAYQIIMLGLTFSVALRVVQKWVELDGGDIADAVTFTNVILVTVATAGAVADPSYDQLGQATRARPRSWSVPRAFALLGVSMMPVWAGLIAFQRSTSQSYGTIVFGCLATVIILLLSRAVVAGRSEESVQAQQRTDLRTDPVSGCLTRQGLLSPNVEGDPAPALDGNAAIVRIWMQDLEDLRETAGRTIAQAVERRWTELLTANLPVHARVVRLAAGQYAIVLDRGIDPSHALDVVTSAAGGRTRTIDLDGEFIRIRSTFAAAELPSLTEKPLDDSLALAGIAHRTQGASAIGSQATRQAWAERTAVAQEILADTDWFGLGIRVQPFIRASDNSVIGFECLSGWTSPQSGRIPTDEFFRIADALTLTSTLDRTIIEQSLAWTGPEGAGPGILSLNCQPKTLLTDDAFGFLLDAHAKRAWRDSTVWLEMIESELDEDSTRLSAILRLLDSEGIKIAVDDFGAGSSTLTRLADFHVSVVKLDRAIVDGIAEDRIRRLIVMSMVDLAGALGLQLVSEGIERADDADVLRDMGCEVFQGYFWSAPVDLDKAHPIGQVVTPARA